MCRQTTLQAAHLSLVPGPEVETVPSPTEQSPPR